MGKRKLMRRVVEEEWVEDDAVEVEEFDEHEGEDDTPAELED